MDVDLPIKWNLITLSLVPIGCRGYGTEVIIFKCDKLIISRLGPITMTSEISSRRAWYRVGNRVGTKIITMYTQES